MSKKVTAKDKIVDAFYKESAKKPVSELQVAEITAVAQVNRGTFYEYFKDVNDLVDQAESMLLNEIIETILALLDKKKDATLEDYLVAVFKEHFAAAKVLCKYGDNGFAVKLTNTLKPFMVLILGVDGEDEAANAVVSYALTGITGYVNACNKIKPEQAAKDLSRMITAMANA